MTRELGFADIGKRIDSSSEGGRALGIARGDTMKWVSGLGLSRELAEAEGLRSQGGIFAAMRSRLCVGGRSAVVGVCGATLLLRYSSQFKDLAR
jgi:hypothetical protein